MALRIVAWALLAWFAIGLARTLLPLAASVDSERRGALRRSGFYYAMLVVGAVLDATGAIAIAVAMYAALGFIVTALETLK